MGAQTRTDVLPYISLIPVFGYLWPGTSSSVRYRTGNYNCSSKPSLFDFFFDFFGGTI